MKEKKVKTTGEWMTEMAQSMITTTEYRKIWRAMIAYLEYKR